MSREERRARRKQHQQDEHVIEHLAGDLTPPGMGRRAGRGAADDGARGGETGRHFGPRRGKALQEAIRKEWTPAKGGLPDF